jgi:SAM-dependent methyltransferase
MAPAPASDGDGQLTGAQTRRQWEAHCAGWKVLDDAILAYLDTQVDVPSRWLLIQTLATAASRRHVLATLGVQAGWRTLDIGTGFAPVPMELACTAPIDALGIDMDESVLQVADGVRNHAERLGAFLPGSRVTLRTGDAYRLDEPDACFDLATARFVFQHLQDNAAAASELARVVKPGGLACLIDVDDGLSVTYPARSAAHSRLVAALTAMQEHRGGGRQVGRTLPSQLDKAGFEVLGTLLIPEVGYRASHPEDLQRTFLVERFTAARADMVDGFISEEEFDDCLGRFSSEIIEAECVLGGHVAVVGRRRPS